MSEQKQGFDYNIIWDKYGMILVFVLLFALCAVCIPNFISGANMKALGNSVSTVGMVSCGMVFCLALADLDLSVGAVVACSGVVTSWILRETGGSIPLGVAGGLACGLFFGALNGFFIAIMKNNALIVTLATQQVARGTAYTICGGVPIGILNENFYSLGSSSVAGIPMPIIITAICFVIFGLLLSNTVFGRNTLALGGNAEAARLAGISVVKTKMWVFVLTGLVCAVAGIVLTARLTSGQPMNSMGLELSAISACVLGGVSLTGGIGKMSTVVAGVLILGVVEDAMNLLNINTFTQYIVRGSILLAAINLDQYKQKLRHGAK